MLAWIREALFGNWRNKGVALFFAVTIWYVAYQSEFQEHTFPLAVRLEPRQDDKVIIRRLSPRRESLVPFSGEIVLRVNGSRKQIEDFDKIIPKEVVVPIDTSSETGSGRRKHFFSDQDLTFLRFSLIAIKSFDPEYVEVEYDTREERVAEIEPSYATPSDMETEVVRADPASVKLSGPQSLLGRVRVVAEANFQGLEREFRSKVKLNLRPETLDGLQVARLVSIQGPAETDLFIRLRARQDTFDHDSVRINFVVPPVKFPYRIQFDERSIPITFKGPEREIARLREQVTKPDFFLAVRVPELSLSADKELDFTFTEDQLLLLGFSSDIQKLQHEERRSKGLGAWSYTFIPVQPEGE